MLNQCFIMLEIFYHTWLRTKKGLVFIMTTTNYTQIVTQYAFEHGIEDSNKVIMFVRNLIDSSSELMKKYNIRQRCLNNQFQQAAVILAYKKEIAYDPESLMNETPTVPVKVVTHSAPHAKHDMTDGSISLSLNADEVMRIVTTYCYKKGLKTADSVSKEVSNLAARVPAELFSSFAVDRQNIYPGAFICLAMDGKINYQLDNILV